MSELPPSSPRPHAPRSSSAAHPSPGRKKMRVAPPTRGAVPPRRLTASEAGARSGQEDDFHPFCRAHVGLASRSEIWLMATLVWSVFLALTCLAPLVVEQWGVVVFSLGLLLYLLLRVLFLLPTMLRRSRQWCGSPVLGWIVFLLSTVAEAIFLLLASIPGVMGIFGLISVLLAVLSGFLSIPLYWMGGRFVGQKSALMRAAILGDEAQVRALADATSVILRSERGFSAKEYAVLAGHRELALCLEGVEQAAARG